MSCSMTWPQYLRSECRHNGRVVSLSRYECELVSLLLMRRGHILSHHQLIEALYPNPDREPDYAVNLMHRRHLALKRKLPGLIEMVHGRGLSIPIGHELRLAA